MFNESWEGKDLGSFIKTTLAQQVQKSALGGFIKTYGASSLLSTVSKKTSEENALKIADGIDMGYQVPKNIIPIIYGHIGMSNTQFDDGQKPSDLDADKVVQSVKMVISEGPIAGAAAVLNNGTIAVNTPNDTVYHLQHVILNDSYVIDPTTQVANFKDVKYEMTLGDGTTSSKQTATLLKTNPLLDVDIEALDDSINETVLNDLGDVSAGKGVNNVLYWNTAAGRWEAKSFNTLLNEAGAQYNGGAGGDGGTGGTGGSGGTGGEGGVGPSSGDHHLTDKQGVRYTQYNPPPTEVETTGTTKITTTVIEPPTTSAIVVTGKGAPLREATDTTPYFQSQIDLLLDGNNLFDTVDATLYWPDGIYKDMTTITTTVDGTITLCETTRPIASSGDLTCLTPNVTISADGQTATTRTRVGGSARVYMVLTTPICGREFILHETSFNVGHFKIGPYEYKHSMALSSMNAGAGTLDNGSQQSGSLDGTSDDCNSTDLQKYNFKDWTLSDYLTAYPDQIVKAATEMRVYAWIDETASLGAGSFIIGGQYTISSPGDTNFTLIGAADSLVGTIFTATGIGSGTGTATLTSGEKTLSTNTYLREMSVCSDVDDYKKLYTTQATNVTPFAPFAPDYSFDCYHYPSETGVEEYDVPQKRCAVDITGGAFSVVKNPDPLLVWDYSTMATTGDTGTNGAGGVAGDSGDAGTSGTVTVPNLDPIPSVDGKDGSYPGDGVATVVTLPTISVYNDDPAANNTLTITVSSGTLDAVTIPAGVTPSGETTASLVLGGAIADIQTCLTSGITYSSTTATTGDVALTLTISSPAGQSLDNKVIRSQAATAYVAPYFTITVNDYSAGNGVFDGYVRGTAIMNSVGTVGVTTNDIAAQLISANIDSYVGNPEWTATVSGNIVTVTGPVGLGASYNGIQPTYTGTMDATMSIIAGGVSPTRQSQPVRTTGNIKARFIPATAFSNTLTDTTVAFAQLAYRPPQSDGLTTLSEVGFMVGGRLLPQPTAGSFTAWKDSGYATTESWDNTPAWAFYDYLTSTVYGLGNDIDSKLDADQKENLYRDIYNLAVWCSQSQGGNQIIDCNAIIYGAESKIEVLQKIAALGHGKFVYLNGNPRLIFDGDGFEFAGANPIVRKIVNQSSAGNLVYQSGSIDNLYNVINVKYANRDNFYRLEEVQYKNTASIATFGERETTVDLWGCSVKQQAYWHGAWIYETEASNSETVTYIAGWDHFDVLPGDLLCLNDTLRPDTTSLIGGRMLSGTSKTLDRDVGASVISVVATDTNGVIQYGTASGTTAVISGTFSDMTVWNQYSAGPGALVRAQNYRVIAIEESEDGIYAVTAQSHDPDKYNRVWLNTI